MNAGIGIKSIGLGQVDTLNSASSVANKNVATKDVEVTAKASSAVSVTTAVSDNLKAIQENLGLPAPFDSAKVDTIKSQIELGRYVVDSGAIADGMIASTTGFIKP